MAHHINAYITQKIKTKIDDDYSIQTEGFVENLVIYDKEHKNLVKNEKKWKDFASELLAKNFLVGNRSETLNELEFLKKDFHNLNQYRSKLSSKLEDLIKQLVETRGDIHSVFDNLKPDQEELMEEIRSLQDKSVKTASNTLNISISRFRGDLDAFVEEVVRDFNYQPYIDKTNGLISKFDQLIHKCRTMIPSIEEMNLDIKAKIIERLNVFVADISGSNFKIDKRFVSFLKAVNENLGTSYEIEIYQPSIRDDELYARYLDLCESGNLKNRSKIMTLLREILPNIQSDILNSTVDLMCQAIKNEYFA